MFNIVKKSIEWGHDTLTLETGKIARQADGAVLATYGETTVLAAVVFNKAPKPGQDRRFDLPSIGPLTVEGAARAGLAGIAVVGGSTIMAEPEKLALAADRADIFVVGMAGGTGS